MQMQVADWIQSPLINIMWSWITYSDSHLLAKCSESQVELENGDTDESYFVKTKD